MNALSIILNIVLILISLILIVVVLMQQGQRQGLGAISGGAETFFGKGKARGLDAKLQKITKIAAVAFIVLAIATTMVVAHINNNTAEEAEAALQATLDALSEEDLAALEAGEAHLHEDGTIHYGDHTEEAAEAPAEEAVEAPAEEAAEAPAEEAVEAPAEEAAEAPAEEAVEAPAEEAAEAPAEETEEAPAEEAVEAPAEETEEAPAEEAAQAE